MYNDFYLLKRVKEEQGVVSYASVQDSFIFKGEVVKAPYGLFLYGQAPQVGDVVLFLKGSGEDVQVDGETYKIVRQGDLIMKI